jgi:hypothetical protein
MKNKYFFLLILFALFNVNLYAQWVQIDKSSIPGEPQKVTLISDNETETILRVDLSGFNLKTLAAGDKVYQTADLYTDIFTARPGYPELPYIAKILAIPDQAGISVEIIETGEVFTYSDVHIPPARESWWEGADEPAYTENVDAYALDAFYPSEFASVEEPGILRDFRISRLSIFPVRYNPVKKQLQVISSVTVKINYGKGQVVNPKTSPRRAIASSYAAIYKSSIFNYKEVLNRLYGGREEGQELMLCIMPDEFVESFQTYADWNRQTGTDIHITPFSAIGANGNNPEIIKDHITDAYYNWSVVPTYVLIVGDDGVFPKKIVSYPDYSFASDDFFVSVEGGDFFPEMMIGRFTNQGDYRMRVMINKYQLYEQFPYTDDTDWFKQGVCCSNNDYESQVETKRFAYACMTEDGGFTHVDTLMSDGDGWGWNCSMDVDDIIDAIEDGRSYLNYRGEGWNYGWYATCYDFYTDHVGNIQNGQKFTFVTSIGCGVAMFDAGGGNCFGEEWIQMGSISEPRGGIGFIGPTSNTHTTYNNRIDKGIYVGMFREGMDTPGQAMARGKLYMYNVFGSDPYVEYHYKVFHVLGDPSIHIWKDVPLEVNVDHVETIPVGNNQLEVSVSFSGSGLPADSALVCVSNNEIFATAYCDENGLAVLDIVPTLEDTLVITVRGGNVYPHQSVIDIIQPEELVEPEGQPEMVDLNGNNDGLLNPDENCEIAFTLKNWGVFTVNDIEATLTSDDPNVEMLSTEPVYYGSMEPGEEITGDPFAFHIDALCPIGHNVAFILNVSSELSSWQYNYHVEIKGCHLGFDAYMVGDEGSLNMNYRMDPGETVRLFISIVNDGDDMAPNVSGVLSSIDPYITVDDETATFGTLDIDGVAINTEDYFVVTIDPACPTSYFAGFTLELFTQDGYYPYETSILHSFPVALPVPTDYTGPDDYGYYAYANTDAFYDQTPEYDWVEISGTGAMLNMYGETDYTETVDLPFIFKYYGFEYDKLRISTDGWMAFGNGVQTAPQNYSLPHNDNVSNMVAVFWDDLYDTQFEDGAIFYYHDQDNNRFIIEWDSITHNNAGPEPIREEFQAVLLDPEYYQTNTGDGEIIMQYRKVEDVSQNTIGIENQPQDIGLQYVYNSVYDPSAAIITGETAIKFTTEAPFVSMIVSIDEQPGSGTEGFGFVQSNPNPFHTSTRIDYSLSQNEHVNLEVYNIRGELVQVLFEGSRMAGNHSFEWNTGSGEELKSGVYFIRLRCDGFVQTKKVLKLK